MTELEYEKACRGPLLPEPGEYAWGTAKIAGTTYERPADPGVDRSHAGYVLRNAGGPDERVEWVGDHPGADCGMSAWDGAIPRNAKGRVLEESVTRPLRVGIFATPDSGRVSAGASYWGILELSGNLWERVITPGNPYGRRFDGTHGARLQLPRGGPQYWMGQSIRGGAAECWPGYHDIERLRVSDRRLVSNMTPLNPGGFQVSREMCRNLGFRCVRTARIGATTADTRPVAAVPRPMRPPVLSGNQPDDGPPVLRRVNDGWEVGVDKVATAVRDAKTATITFDITWTDSWRDRFNHDAAWVFFKARTEAPSNELGTGPSEWRHVRLAADRVVNPTGYSQGDGTAVDLVVPDGEDGFTGLFVQRSQPGEGELKTQGITVIMDLASLAPGSRPREPELRAFAIRMVYVPEGPFYLGAGGVEHGGFYRYGDGTQRMEPFPVTHAGAIPTGRKEGGLWTRKHGGPLVDGGEIPASFPNGFSAFYCMKHQITPPQYADFLNMLPKEQAEKRYAGRDVWVPPTGPKDTGCTSGNYSGGQGKVFRDPENPKAPFGGSVKTARAGAGCFGLSWADGAAYAAWAGLRPMSELECEKIVRGAREPSPNEVGFSFWGVSGFNGWDWNAFKGDPQCERAVTVGHETGRGFKGTHGLGTVDLPADWPQEDAVGSGFRSSLAGYGTWDLARTRVSDRLLAAVADAERRPSNKWRGVRTAPKGAGPKYSMPNAASRWRGFDGGIPRLADPIRVDGATKEWGKPSAILAGPFDAFPFEAHYQQRRTEEMPWQEDLGVRLYWGHDGDALYLVAEVTDDQHFNNKMNGDLGNGDAMQVGLINPDGAHLEMKLALTSQGAEFEAVCDQRAQELSGLAVPDAARRWFGKGDALAKAAAHAVVRDEAAKTTCYELRLPLAEMGLRPGAEFNLNVAMGDDDDGKGLTCWMSMAEAMPGRGYDPPPVDILYPRFRLEGK